MDSRMKDLHRLIKTIDNVSDGQASVDLNNVDWDQAGALNSFLLVIRPNAGHYKGGRFEFKVTFPFDYPSDSPPAVWCNTRVYHPNIDMDEQQAFDDTSTNVCLNIFDFGVWQSSYTLDVMVMGLVFLFHHPNLNDPLADGFTGLETEEEFAENVRKYLAGEKVGETVYEKDFCVFNGVVVERDKHSPKSSTGKVEIQCGPELFLEEQSVNDDQSENDTCACDNVDLKPGDTGSVDKSEEVDLTYLRDGDTLLCEANGLPVNGTSETLQIDDSVTDQHDQQRQQEQPIEQLAVVEEYSIHMVLSECNSDNINNQPNVHLGPGSDCDKIVDTSGKPSSSKHGVDCETEMSITEHSSGDVDSNRNEENEINDENMNERLAENTKSKHDGAVNKDLNRDINCLSNDGAVLLSPGAEVTKQLEMEYACIDGEYILKPKSLVIEETGVLKVDAADDDDFWTDDDIERELEREFKSIGASHVHSRGKGISRISNCLGRYAIRLRHAMTRIFRPCRR